MVDLTPNQIKRAKKIDTFLERYTNTWGTTSSYTKKSPLRKHGNYFVYWADRYKIDELLVLAIAGHETAFGTYKPCQKIFNAWGFGPHWNLYSWPRGIARVTRTLRKYYIDEGRKTIPTIGAKWAPVGAQNDPRNLNSFWVKNVTAIYKSLGGKIYLPK